MPYTTPVFDRTQADITAQNAKAFLNVADFIRIYDNAEIVNGLFTSEIGYTIQFDALTNPTTASIPTKTYLNTLLANIERMRFWAATYLSDYISDPLFVEIKDDWGEGYSESAPNFTHINSWEKVLDVMYNIVSDWTVPTIAGNWQWEDGTDWELETGGNWEHE